MLGLNVAHGLPLCRDVRVLSPISRNGEPRSGTSNRRGGSLLEAVEEENDRTYCEVLSSGLGALRYWGVELYGRWGRQAVLLVPQLARESVRGLHWRIRRGTALGL